MSASANGDLAADGDHGLMLLPTVAWPRTMIAGTRYLVEVDLDLVTADGTPPAVWPFDQEEYAYTCLLGGGADFSLWAVRDASVVVHRFGGSYGPAQFIVTAGEGRTENGTDDLRSLRLTILNPWGVPIDTCELAVHVYPDDGTPLPEPTVDVPFPGPEGDTRLDLPGPPSLPATSPDLGETDNLARRQHDRHQDVPPVPGVEPPSGPGVEPLDSGVGPLSFRASRPLPAGLTEEYGLVALSRSRSGRLRFDRVPLFGLGDEAGSVVRFTVRCMPSDHHGTVFAIFAESPSDPEAPPRLLAMRSAEIPPGSYELSAELLYPGPGYVRLRGLPVPLRDDLRPWGDVIAAVPPDFPEGTGPIHLIAAIEISGEPALVLQRVQRVTELFEHVAEASAEPASYSVITYGPHHINSDRDAYPEIAVRTLAWEVPAESALDTLGGLAYRGALRKGYPFAAQLECVLAELADRLTGREGRPVLITAGARPPHPPYPDPATRYFPCPEHNDGLALRGWLKSRHPGMAFGAIRDPGTEDTLWEQLGSDVANSAFFAPEFAAGLHLTGQPANLLPLPLLAG